MIRRSLVASKTRPNCLVRLGCSSEGPAENGILRRKYLLRQLPGSTSTKEAFLLKLHSYIGALGLYENVCLLKVTLSVVGIMLR